MVAGRALGMVLISSILGLLVDKISWTAAFLSLAVLTAVPIPLVLRTREAEETVEKEFNWAAFKEFKKNLPSYALGLLGALYSLIINGNQPFGESLPGTAFTIQLYHCGHCRFGIGDGHRKLAVWQEGKLVDRIGRRSLYSFRSW
jgi:PAT family beta-lactamase induction signal transducer AmpG